MSEYVVLDTLEAFQVELGDLIGVDGLILRVDNITDGYEMRVNLSGTIDDGLDEGERYEVTLESDDEVNLFGQVA